MRAINVPSDRRYLECVQNVCLLAFASSSEAEQYEWLDILPRPKARLLSRFWLKTVPQLLAEHFLPGPSFPVAGCPVKAEISLSLLYQVCFSVVYWALLT
jgi:hypothetical protein